MNLPVLAPMQKRIRTSAVNLVSLPHQNGGQTAVHAFEMVHSDTDETGGRKIWPHKHGKTTTAAEKKTEEIPLSSFVFLDTLMHVHHQTQVRRTLHNPQHPLSLDGTFR
jgi:hypothetical protein